MQKGSGTTRDEAISTNRNNLVELAEKKFDSYVSNSSDMELANKFMAAFATHLPGLNFFLIRHESGHDSENLEIDAVREAVRAMLRNLDIDELADLHVDIENKIVEVMIKPNEREYTSYINDRYIQLKKTLEDGVDTLEAVLYKIDDSFLDALLGRLKETEANFAAAYQKFSESEKTMASYEELRESMADADRNATKLIIRLMENM